MPDLSRRTLVGGALALGAVGVLPWARAALAKEAVAARRFYDCVGICTHPNWRATLWGRTDWGSAFLQTGVANARGKIGSGGTGEAALERLRPLFAAGVKICVPIAETNGRDFDLPATRAALDFLARRVGADNISGIESANEFNSPNRKPKDWAARLRSFQDWLHDTVRSNRSFDSVPLIAPSIWGRLTADYRAIGNLEPNVDRGCIHYYTGGRRPTRVGAPSPVAEIGSVTDSTLERALGDARILAPGKPVWMTEFGYRMAGPGANSRGDVSEAVAAKYLLRGLFDIFAEGVEKLFIYTLIDDVHRDPPRYHGLMDGSLRPRQSFFAVRNLMALFKDRMGSYRAGDADYSLSGGGAALKHHLFSRSDGTFLIVLYRDVDSYDRWTRREIAVAPEQVRLKLATPASRVEIFDPGASDRPVRTVIATDTVELPVKDEVLVVEVSPAGGQPKA